MPISLSNEQVWICLFISEKTVFGLRLLHDWVFAFFMLNTFKDPSTRCHECLACIYFSDEKPDFLLLAGEKQSTKTSTEAENTSLQPYFLVTSETLSDIKLQSEETVTDRCNYDIRPQYMIHPTVTDNLRLVPLRNKVFAGENIRRFTPIKRSKIFLRVKLYLNFMYGAQWVCWKTNLAKVYSLCKN